MEALVLAGGFGTRLRPLTYTRPKPLLPVAGRPMIEWVLDRLPSEVERVVVAVNWQAQKLEAYFAETDHRFDFVVVREDEPLGTAGAVKNCESSLTSDRFFVLNADIISDMDLDAMLARHQETGAESTISLKEVPPADVVNYGVVRFSETEGETDRITGFVEKPATPAEAPSRMINAGAYLMERSILNRIPGRRMVSMEKETFPQIIDGHASDQGGLWGHAFDGYWMDVGDAPRLLAASEHVAPGQWHPGDAVLDEAFADGSLAGRGLAMGAGSRITRCVLGDDVRIDAGVELTDCVVGDGQHVSESASGARIWAGSPPAGYPEKQVGNAI